MNHIITASYLPAMVIATAVLWIFLPSTIRSIIKREPHPLGAGICLSFTFSLICFGYWGAWRAVPGLEWMLGHDFIAWWILVALTAGLSHIRAGTDGERTWILVAAIAFAAFAIGYYVLGVLGYGR